MTDDHEKARHEWRIPDEVKIDKQNGAESYVTSSASCANIWRPCDMNGTHSAVVTLTLPRVVSVTVTDDTLSVDLEDGRTIAVPIGWYPRLAHGSPAERADVQISGAGYGLHWPELPLRHPFQRQPALFWDLERGNPYVITSFPTPDSVAGYQKVTPNPQRLVEEQVGDDYIVLTQRPNYQSEAAWQNEAERPGYIRANKLRFLRPYQLKAIRALQRAVKDGKDRFLFEMATGPARR